jgi:arsenate reductase-like glutaredoxin family protein
LPALAEEIMPCKCVGSVYVTIYSTPTWIEGQQARHFFESKGVPYEELNVSTDPEALKKLRELSGQIDRPAIIVDEQVFVGFDRSQLESAVPSFF